MNAKTVIVKVMRPNVPCDGVQRSGFHDRMASRRPPAWGDDAAGLTEAEVAARANQGMPEGDHVCSSVVHAGPTGAESWYARVKRDQRSSRRGAGRRPRSLILSRQYLVRETCLDADGLGVCFWCLDREAADMSTPTLPLLLIAAR